MPRRFGNVSNSGVLLPSWKNSKAVTISCWQRKLSEGNGTSFGRIWTFDNDVESILNQSGIGLRWHRKYGAGSSFKQCDWTFPTTGVAYQHTFVDAGLTDNVATDPMKFYLNGALQTPVGTSSSTNGTTPQIRTADMYIGNRGGLDRAWDGVFDYFAMWEVAQPKSVAEDLADGAHPLDYPLGLIVFLPMEYAGEINQAPAWTNRIGVKPTWTGTSGGRSGFPIASPRAQMTEHARWFVATSPPLPPPSTGAPYYYRMVGQLSGERASV